MAWRVLMAMPPHPKWKVCLVGSAAVGKTSLIRRYVVDEFDDKYLTTLGTKVTKKTVTVSIQGMTEPVRADLAIWDIMGQPSLLELLKDAYFHGAHGIIAVADITRRPTLEELDFWVRKVTSTAGPTPLVLAVNKSDLGAQAEVGLPDIQRFASSHGCEYFLTSAKTGDRVETVFQRLAETVAQRMFSKVSAH